MNHQLASKFRVLMMITSVIIFPSLINAKPPNILFVIVDDLRPVLGAYGDTKAHTPNIDLLSSRGVVFERAYAQQALCAPSRNSLLTSRRPDDIGLYDFYSYWRQFAGNFTTLPEHLKNHGYRTIGHGKVFHPGISSNYSDDEPYSWSVKPFHPSTERYKNAPVCPGRDDDDEHATASNLICPVRVSDMPNGTLPDLETLRAAKEFLNKRGSEPFFLAVGFQKPHIPLKYPKKYLKFHPLKKFSLPRNYEWPRNVSDVAYNPWTDLRKRSDVRKLRLDCPWEKVPEKFAIKLIQSYYAAVTYVDCLVGELLQELDDLKIRNQTIIVFTSDHGWSLGEHAVWSKYSNFEVAVRVPLIISVPNITFYHSVVSQPVELLDIFPTIAEFVGFPIPTCPRKNQSTTMPQLCTRGSSLVPLIDNLTNITTKSTNRIAISQYPRPGMKPVCSPSSDKPRLRNISVMGYSIRTIRYRYTAWVNFSHKTKLANWQKILADELYDHNVDPEEDLNLANVTVFREIKNTLQVMLMERLES